MITLRVLRSLFSWRILTATSVSTPSTCFRAIIYRGKSTAFNEEQAQNYDGQKSVTIYSPLLPSPSNHKRGAMHAAKVSFTHNILKCDKFPIEGTLNDTITVQRGLLQKRSKAGIVDHKAAASRRVSRGRGRRGHARGWGGVEGKRKPRVSYGSLHANFICLRCGKFGGALEEIAAMTSDEHNSNEYQDDYGECNTNGYTNHKSTSTGASIVSLRWRLSRASWIEQRRPSEIAMGGNKQREGGREDIRKRSFMQTAHRPEK